MTTASVPAEEVRVSNDPKPFLNVEERFEIDAELAKALPKPSPEERQQLVAEIKRDGITSPYYVWAENRKLLDG